MRRGVVKILSEVCRARRVIVATHHAHIPMRGDAALIRACDAAASQSSLLACGGLADRRVVEHARHIREGGDAACNARQQREQARQRLAYRSLSRGTARLWWSRCDLGIYLAAFF